MNTDKTIIFGLRVALVSILLLVGFSLIFNEISQPQKVSAQDTPIFFYLDECPYCNQVMQDLAPYDIESKIGFAKVQVNTDENKELLGQALDSCGIDRSAASVPFFYYQKECSIGYEDVIIAMTDLAGIEDFVLPGSETTTETEPEPAAESTAITIDDSLTTNDTSTDQSSDQTSESQTTLGDTVTKERPAMGWETIAVLIFVPSLFLLIGYLLLNKMKF